MEDRRIGKFFISRNIFEFYSGKRINYILERYMKLLKMEELFRAWGYDCYAESSLFKQVDEGCIPWEYNIFLYYNKEDIDLSNVIVQRLDSEDGPGKLIIEAVEKYTGIKNTQNKEIWRGRKIIILNKD